MKILYLKTLIALLLLTSCVSKKKYTALQDSKTRLENELVRLQEVEADYQQLQKKYNGLQEEFDDVHKNFKSLSTKYSNLKNAHDRLQEDYNALLENNKELMKTASEEKQDLSAKLLKKQEQLRRKENELRQLSLQLDKKQTSLVDMKEGLQSREEKIQSLQSQLQAQQEQLEKVQKKVSEALLGFPEEDLSIEKKNGKIYVSMSQNLLFAKGSDNIDPKGVNAIKKLAGVLKNHPSVDIDVEGHTDSDGSIERNWELSTERATAVVEILQNNGVAPERLTASGRALYAPVAPNNNKHNKALNRRTEIILSPDLSSLFKLVNNNQVDGDSSEN